MLLGTRLYRHLLREARSLPDELASSYYRERVRTSFRVTSGVASDLQVARRTKRAQQLLRQLQAANDGYLHALTRTIETAHGLRGPQKHIALAPFLARDHACHAFSPPLAALVGSALSHTSRPPTPAQLVRPPTLPERADPTSEEARLLGPLVPERVRAIRRRWWNAQTSKVRPPLAVKVVRDDDDVSDPEIAAEILRTLNDGLEGVRLEEGHERVSLLERKATVPAHSRPLPPRRLQNREQRDHLHPVPVKTCRPIVEDVQRRTSSPTSRNTKWHNPKQITGRLLRRRASQALEIAPIVHVHVGRDQASYEVVRSQFAKGERGQFSQLSEEDYEWLQLGSSGKGTRGKQKPR
ncbi:hypothetical protein JCM11491_003847 [Sporobolomyces phaffii]